MDMRTTEEHAMEKHLIEGHATMACDQDLPLAWPPWSDKGAKGEGVDPGLAIVVREGGDEEVVHPDLCHSMTIMVRKQ